MKIRLTIVALAMLTLAGCAGASPPPASGPAVDPGAPAAAAGGGSTATCAAVDDMVVGIIGPVAHPTDRAAADVEICTWIGGSDGRGVATFIATIAPASHFDQLAKAVAARGYGTGTPLGGFDRARDWTDESMGTFVVVASAGSKVVQLEGSAAKIPDTAALAAIAHVLVG